MPNRIGVRGLVWGTEYANGWTVYVNDSRGWLITGATLTTALQVIAKELKLATSH